MQVDPAHERFMEVIAQFTRNLHRPPPQLSAIEEFIDQFGDCRPRAAKTAGRDQTTQLSDNQDMEPVSRPELDAKLEAIEARMDARLARIEAAAEGIQRDVDKMGNLKHQVWGAALTIILAVVGVVIGIQQMTVSTFQAASQQPTTSPVIIQMPQGAVSAPPPPSPQPSK